VSQLAIEHGLGRKRPKRDDRDFMLRDYVPLRITGTRALWPMVDPTMRIDQGNEGTCVGHGCTNVLMAGPSEHRVFPSFASTASAHIFARKLYFDATGDATYQQGAYTRDALDVLKKRGQIGAYYRLGTVDEIIATLLNFGPVVFGSTWYSSMDDPIAQFNNQYLRVDASSEIRGGHLYCFTGVDLKPLVGPPFVRQENSWGPGFAKNGTARISIDDLHVLYDGDAYRLVETAF